MPSVVADSSVLIHLAAIGRLILLRDFYEKIWIPPAVWKEVVEEGYGRPGAREVEVACYRGWIEVVAPANQPLVELLKRDLDAGEAEVIALGLEHENSLILLDESEGRRVAERYGLRKTGTIGILMRAKREGKISSLQAELDALRRQMFRIDEQLYEQVLRVMGEGKLG